MKKTYLGVAVLMSGLALGEYIKPIQHIQETITYHNVPIGKSFPEDPWNYSLQREFLEKDGKTYQGLYLVNETRGIHKKIDDNGCTCSIDQGLDDLVESTKDWFKKQQEKAKEFFDGSDSKIKN
jgi:hypothetical protein